MSYKKYALVPYEMYLSFMKQDPPNTLCASKTGPDTQDSAKEISKEILTQIMDGTVSGAISKPASKELLLDVKSLLPRSSVTVDSAVNTKQTPSRSVNVDANIVIPASKIKTKRIKNKKHSSKVFKKKNAHVSQILKSKQSRDSKWLKLF